MPKRKREAADTSAEPEAYPFRHGPLNPQRARPDERIHHGRKLLHRALKIAKGFERQKLGRRRKTAAQKKDDEDVARLDTEIQALKTLDLNSAAEAHLNKTLLKEKAISASPLLPSYVKAASKLAQDPATANVTARLYNSNPVKEAFAEILPSIRASLGVKTDMDRHKNGSNGASDRKKGGQKEVDAKELVESGDNHDEYQVESEESVSGSEQGQVSLTRNKPGKNIDMDLDEDEDDEDFEDLDARIASQSDDDSLSDFEKPPDISEAGTRVSHPAIDLSLSPSPSRSPSPPRVPKVRTSRKEAPPSASTTFLPSLTMGGYWSGSDSGSEPEQDIEEPAPRKNRRGQRARQQIWEKKFGKGAKHLVNGKGSKQGSGKSSRDKGWDLKRGAQMDGGDSRKGGYQPRWKQAKGADGRNGTMASGGNMTQLGKRPTRAGASDTKPLHPSWEAAKKAKEQRQTGSFEGKKVVFD